MSPIWRYVTPLPPDRGDEKTSEGDIGVSLTPPAPLSGAQKKDPPADGPTKWRWVGGHPLPLVYVIHLPVDNVLITFVRNIWNCPLCIVDADTGTDR